MSDPRNLCYIERIGGGSMSKQQRNKLQKFLNSMGLQAVEAELPREKNVKNLQYAREAAKLCDYADATFGVHYDRDGDSALSVLASLMHLAYRHDQDFGQWVEAARVDFERELQE